MLDSDHHIRAFPGRLQCAQVEADGSQFIVLQQQREVAELCWEMLGDHNIANALAAIAAAAKVGVSPGQAVASLGRFRGVKRRLEKIAEVDGICVYDDFAHHPTAIESTLAGLRSKVGSARIFALLEPRSNTMKLGVHQATLGQSVREADFAWWYQPATAAWRLADSIDSTTGEQRVFDNVERMIDALLQEVRSSDHVLVMSNGAFDDIHRRLIRALEDRHGAPV